MPTATMQRAPSLRRLLESLDRELPQEVAHVTGWLETLERFFESMPSDAELERFLDEVRRLEGARERRPLLHGVVSILVGLQRILPPPRSESFQQLIDQHKDDLT